MNYGMLKLIQSTHAYRHHLEYIICSCVIKVKRKIARHTNRICYKLVDGIRENNNLIAFLFCNFMQHYNNGNPRQTMNY